MMRGFGYPGFGAVPNDETSASANMLIVYADQQRSDDASALVHGPNGAAICQRAQEILALPPCNGHVADGSCVESNILTNDPASVAQTVSSMCGGAGAPASGGMSTAFKVALFGGAALLAIVLVKKS